MTGGYWVLYSFSLYVAFVVGVAPSEYLSLKPKAIICFLLATSILWMPWGKRFIDYNFEAALPTSQGVEK